MAAGAILVASCSGASPTTSVVPTESPTRAANSGPAWCDPTAQLLLQDPTGAQVVLPAVWDSDFLGLTYVLRQIGDCIWMSGFLVPHDADGADGAFLTQFVGRLGSDFRIVGEFADLNGQAVVGWDDGSIAFEIQFTDAGLVLVEDRSAEEPPGCADSSLGACPDLRTLTPRPD